MDERLNQLFTLKKQIFKTSKMLEDLNLQLKELETQIYKTCQHQWGIDRFIINEHTIYICHICGLYKRESI